MSYISTLKKLALALAITLLFSNIVYAGMTDEPEKYDGEKEISINFKGLKIADLIDITSKLLNRNILLTKKIGGTVDFIANRPLTQSDALDILMYTLEAKGYTIVDSGNMLRVVKISDVSKYNIPIQKDKVRYPKQEVVTQVFSVPDVSVDYIAAKVRHFMSRSAKLVTDKETNSMILTDFASNIKTVQMAIDILAKDGKKVIKTIPLKNIQAASIVPELKKVAKTVFNAKISKEKVAILANKDTNSVMFVGSLKNVNYMSEYLLQVESGGSLAQKAVEIISLKNGDAANVFKVVGGIIGNKKYKNPDDKPFVSLDSSGNNIIVRASKSEIKFIRSMIESLDVDKQQVYVKVKIIEVSEKKSREVGLKYGLVAGAATSSGLGTLTANLGGSVSLTAPLGLSVPTGLTEGLALGTTLNLLQTNGAAELLSSPLLLCINNKESSIYAGSTKSIKTGSTVTTGGTASDKFKREDIGLTLKIKPRISTGNKVRLDIGLVLEDVDSTQTNGQPDTTKKEISTTAIVNDGENVILGGYTREKSGELVSKVPLLGDIPLLGRLFTNTNTIKDKVNLVVIITPYIVPKSKDLTFIRNKLASLKLLEDRYSQITLLRLEQQRLRNQELELETKDEMLDVADVLLDNSDDIREMDADLQEYLDDMEDYDPVDKFRIATMFGMEDRLQKQLEEQANQSASEESVFIPLGAMVDNQTNASLEDNTSYEFASLDNTSNSSEANESEYMRDFDNQSELLDEVLDNESNMFKPLNSDDTLANISDNTSNSSEEDTEDNIDEMFKPLNSDDAPADGNITSDNTSNASEEDTEDNMDEMFKPLNSDDTPAPTNSTSDNASNSSEDIAQENPDEMFKPLNSDDVTPPELANAKKNETSNDALLNALTGGEISNSSKDKPAANNSATTPAKEPNQTSVASPSKPVDNKSSNKTTP